MTTTSRTARLSSTLLFLLVALLSGTAWAAGGTPMKVYILAGQSNMEGQAVVDLDGPDYNDAKGTLATLIANPAKAPDLAHLRAADGSWRVRDDVWAWYQPEGGPLRAGPLALGFTPYGDQHHFGPELEFGHVMGESLDSEVLLIKTAWGGKSLYVDFRPPSSGGTVGAYYTRMIADVRTALGSIKERFPQSKADGYELAGFVWYQGWNDGCDPKNAVPEYEANLVNLIHDVRKDLDAPKLPVVVGEITGAWVKAPGEWERLRQAQAAAAARPEFKGNVAFVPTHNFVRAPEDSPNPGHGHHEFGNAETYFLVGEALGHAMVDLTPGAKQLPMSKMSTVVPTDTGATPKKNGKGAKSAEAKAKRAAAKKPKAKTDGPEQGEMAGYLLVSTEQVPKEFNAGFSIYAAAWPLVKHYPGHRFQTGLFGTWMHAQYEGKAPENLYSDIEGGLGWWRDTRFPTETPKFIMGGVGVNFSEIANGPAHGAGSWEAPAGLYGVAQLSPWLLFPIDGLNLKQGTCGQLFGYGYLPLPFTAPKTTTAGKDIATGDNCWTLFLNTANFKGPVCFFTPYFWSHAAVVDAKHAGLLLDSRPSDPNKAFQMETQHVPAALATTATGETFARVAPTSFPVGADGKTVVLHRLTAYTKAALWDGVKAWFEGGAPSSGAVDPAGAFVQGFKPEGGSTWRISPDSTKEDEKVSMAWGSLAKPIAPDPTTYGYEWNINNVKRSETPAGSLVTLPEYYRLKTDTKNPKWVAAKPSEVPGDTGLKSLQFETPKEEPQPPYDTPDAAGSSWKVPGPVAGPFTATLGDGSVVTYCWYRFADQPALLNADLTKEEREAMQVRVEKLHRVWTKERNYMAPPTIGTLADLDPAQLVQPPKGFEIGYVPIAIRQELAKDAKGAK
jgi:hypothetical protein